MSVPAWIITFTLLGSVGSICGAAVVLISPEGLRKKLISSLLSYATGILLGAAFLGIIPEALELAERHVVLSAVLAGIILFFVLEKIVLWRHCHDEGCDLHSSAGPLIIFGDSFHNFVDGIVIASTFLVSIPLGIATSIAIIAHEVPQEVGDFAILLASGYSRQKAFTYNLISSLTSLLGAVIAYVSLRITEIALPYILAISAASFIYIAIGDLIPLLHQKAGRIVAIKQLLLLLGGTGTIVVFHEFFQLH